LWQLIRRRVGGDGFPDRVGHIADAPERLDFLRGKENANKQRAIAAVKRVESNGRFWRMKG
jgi:hypothetical protein